nr:mediator of RNA polymerase II transcription subunit 11 [Pogona vitticeps]
MAAGAAAGAGASAYSLGLANERLRLLEELEREIGAALQSAGGRGLIRYLTQVATGQPHEGSSYSARKDCQMALKRIDYARVKLGELSRTCEQMLEP